MYGTYVAPTFHRVADTSRLMEVYQTRFARAVYAESDNAPARQKVWPRETSRISRTFRFAKKYISLGTLVPNSRDRQGELWLPKKQKMALKTTLQ